MKLARILAPLLLPFSASHTAFPAQEPSREPAPAILSTDLSLDHDPDDWFDTLLFLTLPGIEPKGIVLEHYATDAKPEPSTGTWRSAKRRSPRSTSWAAIHLATATPTSRATRSRRRS